MRQTCRIVAFLVLAVGCEKSAPVSVPPCADGIVCLTPVGTDLLSAMGFTDRIVGVSNFEPDEKLRQTRPKVGDYLNVDFERIAQLRPKFLIVQGKRDRLPSGTAERSKELGVTPIILQVDRLDDIYITIKQIGDAIGETAAAEKLIADLKRRATQLADHRPAKPVPTLLLFNDAGTSAAGRETFIDDALTLAGGKNVVEATGYPTLDNEKVRSLSPSVVFLMLPGASPDVVKRAEAAARANTPQAEVFTFTDADVLMPGTAAMRLAEAMADKLRAVP
ncbi:MAG: ABC transporter substrate-binding protein [Tepidisphaeraceae bacterium]